MSKEIEILFQKENKDVVIPKTAHADDAGYDVYSIEDKTIKNGSHSDVRTGVKLNIPKGYYAELKGRSGFAKRGILAHPGTIDAGYLGEVSPFIFNFSGEDLQIKKGDKIAQLIFHSLLNISIKETENLGETERGEKGHGSTGVSWKENLVFIFEKASKCVSCDVCANRKQVVFDNLMKFEEPPKIMFIGEAPGKDEDEQGRPFVGKAGQLLQKAIGFLGLTEKQFYVSNILKCRPSNNNTPSMNEINNCKKFIDEEIDLIKPKLIVLLGATAFKTFLPCGNYSASIGGFYMFTEGITIYAMVHPAAPLHNPAYKEIFEKNVINLKATIQDYL